MAYKFEDCVSCINRKKKWICSDCDVGELYEDEDRAGVDAVFASGVSRFSEPLSADEDSGDTAFNADRFAESLPENDDDDYNAED